MTYYDMTPDRVQASGTAVSGLTGEAQSVASSLLAAISSAAGQVRHPVMSAALQDYRAAEAASVRAVPDLVQSLGSRTAGSAADVTSADSAGAATLALGISASDQLSNQLFSNPLTP